MFDPNYINLTKEDAFWRVAEARVGCVVGATDDYLVALRLHIAEWGASIDKFLAEKRDRDRRDSEADAT